MEINFSEDVQKALDLIDESDRPEYIQNVVRMQLVRDGRLAGIAWSTGGGRSPYSLGDNSFIMPSDRTEVVTVKVGNVPDGDRTIVKGLQVYAGGGGHPDNPTPVGIGYGGGLKNIVSVATQQEVNHFYDRNNEPARSIYPSHLNRPS